MNLPNKITIARICLIPFVMFFYLATFIPCGKLIAAIIFVVAAYTDFLDGYIARKNNLVTNLGKFLDPIADKVLVMAGLLMIIADGTVLAPYGVIMVSIILARELIIGGFRSVAAASGKVLAADMWGKVKTTITDIALPFYMVFAWFKADSIISNATFLSIFGWLCFGLLAVSTILTIISGVNYVVKNKHVLK